MKKIYIFLIFFGHPNKDFGPLGENFLEEKTATFFFLAIASYPNVESINTIKLKLSKVL